VARLVPAADIRRYVRRRLMSQARRLIVGDINCLVGHPGADPLYERQEPVSTRQIQNTARRPPDSLGGALPDAFFLLSSPPLIIRSLSQQGR
jgi:hypothetical protein